MKKAIFAITTFMAVLICCQPQVLACVCVSMGYTLDQQIKGELKRNGAIFWGEVTEIVPRTTDRNIIFRVDKFWKGDVSEKFTVASHYNDSCEYPFVVGHSFLIFAHPWQGKPFTGTCTLTRDMEKAAEELKILGKGKTPEEKKSHQSVDTKP
jgi:hypothetical protein